jgi:hypothetical protein
MRQDADVYVSEAEARVRKVDAMQPTHKELLMEVAGDLVELPFGDLEFAGDVVGTLLQRRRSEVLDPAPIVAVALEKWRSRRSKN